MSKIKWALDIIKSTSDPAKKLSAYKSIYLVAEKHCMDVEDRIAKPMLLEILAVEKNFKEVPSDYKEVLAKSHYLMAEMISRSAESDREAMKHLDKAVNLMPNFQEAISLRKSIEIDNNFFQDSSGAKRNQ